MSDIETSIGGEGGYSLSMEPGTNEQRVEKNDNPTISFDSDEDHALETETNDDVSSDGSPDDETAGEGLDDDAGAETEGNESETEGDVPEELGDFDPEDADSVERYENAYTAEDGSLNTDKLSEKYFKNLDAGKDGLDDSDYAFLASKGISKATVKQIEAMQATARDTQKSSVQSDDLKIMTQAGGPDKLKVALEWGKAGGYSEADQKRFNKIMNGKDYAAKQDAVDALMARHGRANPPQKPQLPSRDATKGQGNKTQGLKGFASKAEADAAHKAAGEDMGKLRVWSRRRKLSKF